MFYINFKSGNLLKSFINKKEDLNQIVKKEKNLWDKFLKSKKINKKILIATSTGGHPAVTPVESLLAVSLILRGAEVEFLLCDKILPACLQANFINFIDADEFPLHGPQRTLCENCFISGLRAYKSLDQPIYLYSKLLSKKDIKKARQLSSSIPYDHIEKYKYQGLSIGEHAMAGSLRYFARADLKGEKHKDKVLRRYLNASFLTLFVIKNLVSKRKYDCVVFHHGIYVPQGIVGEYLRKKRIRVVNWNPAYRKKCFIFSHNDTYHHTLMSEDIKKWNDIKWNKKLESQLMEYLESRTIGTKDWIWFHEKPELDINQIAPSLGIDFTKPVIGMLTNVMWDAQLHYPANAFPNMISWIVTTINYFKIRKDLQLVIRIHPAEIRGTLPSRQKVHDEIKKKIKNFPKNVFIIPPESNVSTYSVMYKCNTVLIYGTKMGVELTSMGIPVVVAGEAWIRNKGITMDASSKQDYINILDKLPISSKMNEMDIELARKYAFHFFFRRMIPLQSMKETKSWPPYKIELKKLSDLLPNRDNGLDVICDGILKGTDFIYKAEEKND